MGRMKGLDHATKLLEAVYDTIANATDGNVVETVLNRLRQVLQEARFMSHPGAATHPKWAQWATVCEMTEDAMQAAVSKQLLLATAAAVARRVY